MSLVLAAAFATLPGAGVAQSPRFLDQGWSAGDREWMYSFSQGSQIMPYRWFTSLERAEKAELFNADGLERFGYIPRPRNAGNPDGLAVGFALDRDNTGYWIGLNCAACHTRRVELDGEVLQIDGGPANADMFGLIEGLSKAMQATLADPAKFKRFSDRVRAVPPQPGEAQLRAELTAFSKGFAEYVDESRPATAWGPARLDAFGMIFNRVARIDLGIKANATPPNAPVSYPFLWTTNFQNVTQWNGAVPNIWPHERLGRNAGQVLGVFGKMPNLGGTGWIEPRRYKNTVRGPALLRVDAHLDDLRPPKWPIAATPAEAASAARGAALFARDCAGCHIDASARNENGVLEVNLTPLGVLKTDATMATLNAERRVATGPLEGKALGLKPGFLGGRTVGPELGAAELLSFVVPRAILDFSMWVSTGDPLSSFAAFAPISPSPLPAAGGVETLESNVKAAIANNDAVVFTAGALDRSNLTYKGGPLNGIWATGPFLHNGSVPTLADLLVPGGERPKKFKVGSIRLDVKNVGFESRLDGPGVEFDTSLPANSNLGHDYGVALTLGEKQDLVEYIKRL